MTRDVVTDAEFKDKMRRLRHLQKEAVGINNWCERALHRPLTNIGPRLDALEHRMYMGCGVHYALLQRFGGLVSGLSIGFHPSMNWLEKNQVEEWAWISRQVSMWMLCQQVQEAEKSAVELGKKYAQK